MYFAGTLYWLVETMTTFGGLQPAVAAFAALLLVAYLSLFPGGVRVAVARTSRRFGPEALLLAAPAWVATELGRQYVWDGFPWALLGYSQITWLPIAQLASITGVYGLSLLLALTGASAAYLLVTRGSRRLIVAGSVAALVLAIGCVGAMAPARLSAPQVRGTGAGRRAPGEHRAGRQVESGARWTRSRTTT